jgi:O-antigen/teichoic acid export membrane protein
MRQPAGVTAALRHVRTPLYLNAYALITSNLLTSGLGLIYWSLAARLYTVEVVGISSAVIWAATTLTGISQLNLRMALLRLVPAAGARTPRLVWTAYALTLVVTAVVSLAAFGVMAATGAPTLALPGLATVAGVGFLALGTMASSIFNLQDGVLAGLRRTVLVPLENGGYAVTKIILLVFLAAGFPALGIVVSWFVPIFGVVAMISLALAVRWLPIHVAAGRERALELGGRRLLSFVAADYLGSLSALAVSGLLPVLIVAWLGARQGAYFSIVWLISASLNLLPINLCASLTVEAVHSGADLAVEARRAAVHMARLLVPGVIVLLIAAEWVLRIFGPDYAENGTLSLRLLVLSVLPFAVNTLYMAISRIRGRGREILVVQASLAVLTLATGMLLLDAMGVVGVPLAWLLSQSAVAGLLGTTRLWNLLRPTTAAPSVAA